MTMTDSRAAEVLAAMRDEGGSVDEAAYLAAIDRAIAALSQQPEARGVVDEGSRSVTRQLLHWGGVPVHVTGTVTTSPGNWSLIDPALTGERNG